MTVDGAPIPLSVQPILRLLSYAVARGDLSAIPLVCSIPDDLPRVVGGAFQGVGLQSGYNEGPSVEQAEILMRGIPDRKTLTGLFLVLDDVFYWAVMKCKPGLPIPDFIIPEHARVQGKESADPVMESSSQLRRPLEELLDKAMSQGAAIALWDMNGPIPISQVCEHPAFLKAGAKNYSEPTRRKWASEVAPEAVKRAPGRPKKLVS